MTTVVPTNAFQARLTETNKTHPAATVLVVDDHEDTRTLLRYVFESQHYTVIEATDGDEAVFVAQTVKPDIIVMDTTLKRVDGLEATQRIRKTDAVRDVPIVFLSGHAQAQARDAALASGANEYLVKPFSIEELQRVVQNQLQSRKVSAATGWATSDEPCAYLIGGNKE
jgi:two-component system phosphate regulon response regulator PhoB